MQSENKTKEIVIYKDVFRAWWNIQDQAFEKAVNSFKLIIIFAKCSILDVWPSSQYASDTPMDNQNKVLSKTNSLWQKDYFLPFLITFLDTFLAKIMCASFAFL